MLRALLTAIMFAAAAPASAQAIDWSGAITLTIELNDYKLLPETLILYEGQPYRLHFVNSASRGHNFTASRFFGAAMIAPGDAAMVADGQIELDEGESAIVHLIPPPVDEYGARCTHVLHSVFGQTADIEVRPMPALSGGAQ